MNHFHNVFTAYSMLVVYIRLQAALGYPDGLPYHPRVR